MGDLIPFPQREPEPTAAYIGIHVAVTGYGIRMVCNHPTHAFETTDKPCQCGQYTWAEMMSA